ncbi:MAG: hypothetical protein LBV08_04325 [Clostridiales bacterium]|nr:hypothetical protein [Clostridiales bacterium]
MVNTYVIKLNPNKLICFYYAPNEGVAYNVYENNAWSKKEVIFKNAMENYTVTVSENKTILIFCQDWDGNLFMCTNPEGIWRNKVLLENKSGDVNKILFYPIISEKNTSLIYNVPGQDDKPAYLVSQLLMEGGKWSEASFIDNYVDMNDTIFQVYPIANDYALLFYLNRANDLKLGYREVTSSLHGQFNVFHQSAFKIRDQSFLPTDEEIHFLYIIKTYFSSQLIYRKKTDDGFTKPKILWESQIINKCLMFIINNKLYIYFVANRVPMEIISQDFGGSFEKAKEASAKFSADSKKAVFISCQGAEGRGPYIREVFVDAENPCNIQIIPGLWDDFYPVELKTVDVGDNGLNVNEKHYINQINDLREQVAKVKNQLSMARQLLDEKDRQIFELASAIQDRNLRRAEQPGIKNSIMPKGAKNNNGGVGFDLEQGGTIEGGNLNDNYDFDI